MMRVAAKLMRRMRGEPPRKMLSVVKSTPAPVGGWNARDPLAAMPALDAVVLENWFPRVADCVIRGGCANHVTGFGVRPNTLMVHNGLSGTNKMFAATSAGIYDVTSAGAVGAAVLARTTGYHSWVQMAVSGGSYLAAFNGVDKPAFYDGTTWTAVDAVSAPALTGVTTTNLVAANVYKRRLFILEKNKLNFWYLAADAIGGALTEFLLGPLCTRGGYTMAVGTWTLDGGNGPDDYIAFVTSEGEVVIFTGTNPSDATLWTLVGVYYVGKPLGRRCVKKYGGDLVILTEFGLMPLTQIVQSKTVDYKTALTNKIDGAFVDAGRSYGAYSGWMMEILPQQSAILVNVPKADGGSSAEQYVMNTTTKSWCKFTGWNASDLVVFNKELYYADATKIAKAWSTRADYGANIVGSAQTAFNHFNDQRNKDCKLWRPLLRVNGALNYTQGIAVDFEANPQLSAASYSVATSSLWDVAQWDVGTWVAGLEVVNDWRTPAPKMGKWLSGLLVIGTNALEVQWAANDYLYETGLVVT